MSEVELRRMTDALAHRGPDGEGHYVDGPVGLGHRRLAIIDLTASAHQPMPNEDGSVLVTFNGEIYNFLKLRVELEAMGHRFHSRTDSEVVVHAWEEWGRASVDHFDGMFAYAVWDGRRRELFVARDRYGVKPLYWTLASSTFAFASEIKALLQVQGVPRDISHEALNEYFTFQNIFSDLTLFKGIHLLPPGHTISLSLAEEGCRPQVRQYWDYDPPGSAQGRYTPSQAEEHLADLFVSSVTRQLVSDVPVGSYLSGGIDSGSITAVAVRHLPRLTTFTAGFDLSSASGLELGFDERPAAELVANDLKTEHYEVVMHAGDMEYVLPELIWHLEDLRVGQSYPNYYVARLASKFVKVVLAGTGGDELFGGYPWRYYHSRPGSREDYLRQYYGYWQRLVSDEDKPRLFGGDTLRHVGDVSTFDTFREVFSNYSGGIDTVDDSVNASLYFELKTFLPGLLLVEDKLSMAHSLETRVPFLDNELVEFAIGLPARAKVPNIASMPRMDENQPAKRALVDSRMDGGKAVLRAAMARLLRPEVTSRAKQGFSAPDASWFRGESIDYINRLLRDRKAMIYEFLSPSFVSQVLDDHCSGRVNRRLLIWSFLSFEWWCRSFLSGAARDAADPARTTRSRRSKASALPE